MLHREAALYVWVYCCKRPSVSETCITLWNYLNRLLAGNPLWNPHSGLLLSFWNCGIITSHLLHSVSKELMHHSEEVFCVTQCFGQYLQIKIIFVVILFCHEGWVRAAREGKDNDNSERFVTRTDDTAPKYFQLPPQLLVHQSCVYSHLSWKE